MTELSRLDATRDQLFHDERGHRRDANRAVAVSAVGLAITGAVELALAIVTGSVALLGDALHNLSDVSTSAVVFVGFRVSKRAPTTRYPHGYERAEDLAGLGVVLVIWLSAVFAGYESYLKLVSHAGTSHIDIGIAGALLGIIGNQLVAAYKARVGRRIQSATILADAKHSRLDALSSLGALVGLVIVATGNRWGDPVAGFVVTLFILHVGYTVTKELTHHLMDGVDDELVAAQKASLSVAGITDVQLRGRWLGRSLVVEVDAAVNPGLTMTEVDRLGKAVAAAIHRDVPEVRKVRWLPYSRSASASV